MSLDFPTIFLLPTHLAKEELHQLQDQIPTLTHDVTQAQVFLGKISRKERALFELRCLRIVSVEVDEAVEESVSYQSPPKRRKVAPSTSTGHVERSHRATSPSTASARPGRRIRVARLQWFADSVAQGRVLPLDEYLVYEGTEVEDDDVVMLSSPPPQFKPDPAEIMRRAQLDALSRPPPTQATSRRSGTQRFRGRGPRLVFKPPVPPALLRQTTSEHDAAAEIPPIPSYLLTKYSCQRPTPTNPPNEKFIAQLYKIRVTRQLMSDKVGVRAYSSAIASLSAYPYGLKSDEEVSRLPGCGPKIAALYREFKHSGVIQEVQEAESDPKLAVLKQFYEVWGAADSTAREWYNKGWRDLDDVVQYGWDTLPQVQQIGIKFYDDFQLKIPRAEVEAIADVALAHANRIRPGFQMVIAGGYRRGKPESGDVDMIMSHPDESATRGFITQLVVSLQDAGYVPYTLSLCTKNSERGQVPVSWKGNDSKGFRTGFDTLDKAFLVWQDPAGPEVEPTGGKKRKNINPHRRVDIIISPWKTAGCAVLGWSSGITFQRDLRHYCKYELGLKFDSSGIRSRKDGSWVDLEGGKLGKAPDMVTAEKRVFEGLKLEWRPPEERSTG